MFNYNKNVESNTGKVSTSLCQAELEQWGTSRPMSPRSTHGTSEFAPNAVTAWDKATRARREITDTIAAFAVVNISRL